MKGNLTGLEWFIIDVDLEIFLFQFFQIIQFFPHFLFDSYSLNLESFKSLALLTLIDPYLLFYPFYNESTVKTSYFHLMIWMIELFLNLQVSKFIKNFLNINQIHHSLWLDLLLKKTYLLHLLELVDHQHL